MGSSIDETMEVKQMGALGEGATAAAELIVAKKGGSVTTEEVWSCSQSSKQQETTGMMAMCHRLQREASRLGTSRSGVAAECEPTAAPAKDSGH